MTAIGQSKTPCFTRELLLPLLDKTCRIALGRLDIVVVIRCRPVGRQAEKCF